MSMNSHNTYSGMRVVLDNQSYHECTFTNCTIEYAGTGPISLIGCSFHSCNWVMTGNALNTLNFMQSMYHGMGDFGKQMINQTFENVKRNKFKAAPETETTEKS